MKVIRKQNNSKMCIICGVDNALGVKAPFYEMEDGSVRTVFKYRQEHQSYPERVHGGMITCMLDELAGRVIWTIEPEMLAVTTKIEVRFRKPVPYEQELIGTARLVSNSKRGYTAVANITDTDGKLLAEADVTYLKMPAKVICSADMSEELDVYVDDGVQDISLPPIE